MKTEISLDGAEIRQACRQFLQEKFPNKEFNWHDLYYLNDSDARIPVNDKKISYVVAINEE